VETDREILTCQSSPCTKKLRVNPEADNPYFSQRAGFEYNTSVLKTNGNKTGFQATVSHSSDVFKEARLVVDRKKAVSTNNICDITVNSNPATLVCNFNEPAGDDRITYSLEATTDGYTYTLDTGVINEPPNIFAGGAYLAGFLLFASISMIGLASPKTGIVFATAGVLIPVYLEFYALSLPAMGSLVIVALALIAGGET